MKAMRGPELRNSDG